MADTDTRSSPRSKLLRRFDWLSRLAGRSVCATPIVLQMEAVECGAACLAIILAHHGRWIPLEQLRAACGVSRGGSKASNLVAAAGRFGLAAQGFRKEPQTLHQLPMPCIIHWHFNHFVVLEGLKGGRAYINDPAIGRRTVDMAEFDRAFTGVALGLTPTPEFTKGGRKPHVLRILVRELARSKSAVVLLLGLSIALVVPGILIAFLTQIFVDSVVVDHARDWLFPLLIGLAAAAAGRALITALQQMLLLRLETKLMVSMIGRFFWHVLSLPMEFFAQRHAGEIANRVAANEEIARLLSGGVAANALSLASVAFFATAMAIYDWQLAAIAIAISLLNAVALRSIARPRENLSRSLAVERGKLSASMVGIVRTIESLKSSGLEDAAFARWAGFHAKVLNAEHQLGLYSVFLEVCPTLLSVVSIAVVLGFGVAHVMEGVLTLGGLVAFQSLTASFDGPLAMLVHQASQFQAIKADLVRLQDVFNYPAEEPRAGRRPARDLPAKLSGRLEITDLRFGYSRFEPPLIDGLSLTLEPGKRVALVGVSGAGKSTLGRLICGLYEPWSGDIRFDGRPLWEIPPDLFANSMGYVDQDVLIFAGTLRENVTLWDATIADEDISRALKDALIDDVIASRAGYYDCIVAEDGANFSGGERQRIEIARALVRNPSLLIFDEATAALEPAIEKTIDANLRRRGCSCVIVAHRLSTIRDCDEIILLDEGKVVERGSHDKLLAVDGAYTRLVSSQ